MMQYKVRGLAVAALATLATVVGCKTEADDLIMGAKQAEHVSGNTVVPESLAFTAERLATLDVPAGFTITAFATGLGKPRMIAVAGDGTIYVTRQATNDVIALRDDNGDGVAEAPRTVAINLPLVHG
ncbi:MAG: sorbosone dehydrogenase family protein, partial [Gemmatimonadaceae bacterium]